VSTWNLDNQSKFVVRNPANIASMKWAVSIGGETVQRTMFFCTKTCANQDVLRLLNATAKEWRNPPETRNMKYDQDDVPCVEHAEEIYDIDTLGSIQGAN
jgi:hypothetical protein